MLSSSEVIQLSIYTDKYLYNLYFPFTFQTTLRYDDIKYDANICKGESLWHIMESNCKILSPSGKFSVSIILNK